jgi:hypothetical protein
LIDSTPPVKGVVTEEAVDVPDIDDHDQPGNSANWSVSTDIDFFRPNHDHSCVIKWINFTDHESGIYKCMAGIHRGNGSLLWNVGSNSSGSGKAYATRTLFENGKHYYSAVECYNRAGLQVVARSDGFIVDGTPPVISAVKLDIRDAQSLGAEIVGSCRQCYDIESGIEYFKWSSFDATAKDRKPVVIIEKTVPDIRRNLLLIKGGQYSLEITVTNFVGLSTRVLSPIVTFVESLSWRWHYYGS